MKNLFTIAIMVLVIAAGIIFYFKSQGPAMPPDEEVKGTLISSVSYACSSNKTIDARYFEGQSVPTSRPGEMPVYTSFVKLNLSDRRQMTLNQTISASGIRYANSSESIVFWSKGNTAFMTENEIETYQNCIEKSN